MVCRKKEMKRDLWREIWLGEQGKTQRESEKGREIYEEVKSLSSFLVFLTFEVKIEYNVKSHWFRIGQQKTDRFSCFPPV